MTTPRKRTAGKPGLTAKKPGRHRRSSPAARTRAQSLHSPGEYSSPACYLHEIKQGRTSSHEPDVEIRRIYDEPKRTDGEFRVLVDRLWPRGVRKDKVDLDVWAREIAPSTQLRKWFGHDPARWSEFRKRYLAELDQHTADLEALRERARHQHVILLYAAKDPQINHAVVLRDVLRRN